MTIDRLISVTDASKELGISSARVRVLIFDGRLKAQKIGRGWVIRFSDLDAVRERNKAGRPKLAL